MVPTGPGLDTQTKKILEQIKEVSEVGEGQRGDPLLRYLKVQDLLDLGLAKLLSTRAKNIVSGGNLQPTIPVPNMSIPPAPTGFEVVGGLAHIFLQWDHPLQAYSNHSYTLIYRNTEDNIGNAVAIAQVAISGIWADLDVSYGTDYYYWIRFVSSSNIQGPFNSSVGTLGKVSEDPAELLARLQNKITESELFEDLNDRIDLVDGPPELSGSVAARVLAEAILRQSGDAAEASARNAAIASAISYMEEYADGDSASAILLNQLITAFGGNAAAALDFIVTEVDENSATASALTALISTINHPTTGLSTKSSITYVDEAVSDEAIARASAIAFLSAEIDDLDGEISSRATISYVDDAVADEASARASAITTLSSEVDGLTTAVQITASTVNGLSGSYSVKIDNNGLVTGFGLSSETVNGQTNSFFLVNADTFGIVNSGAAKTVTSLTRSSTTATAACTAHGFLVGDKVSISHIYEPGWNGVWTVASVPNANSFTFTVPGTLISPATSRVYISGKPVTSLTLTITTATATFPAAHGFIVGQIIDVTSASQTGWNGQWQVLSVPSSTVITFTVPGSLSTPATSLMRVAPQTIPFVVDAGKVVMDGAFIKNATINDAQVGTITVGKITGLDASFIQANIGTLYVDNIEGDVNKVYSVSSTASTALNSNAVYYTHTVTATVPTQTRERWPFVFAKLSLLRATGATASIRAAFFEQSNPGGASSWTVNAAGTTLGVSGLTRTVSDASSLPIAAPTNWSQLAAGRQIRIQYGGNLLIAELGSSTYNITGGGSGFNHTWEVDFVWAFRSGSPSANSQDIYIHTPANARYTMLGGSRFTPALVSGAVTDFSTFVLKLSKIQASTEYYFGISCNLASVTCEECILDFAMLR